MERVSKVDSFFRPDWLEGSKAVSITTKLKGCQNNIQAKDVQVQSLRGRAGEEEVILNPETLTSSKTEELERPRVEEVVKEMVQEMEKQNKQTQDSDTLDQSRQPFNETFFSGKLPFSVEELDLSKPWEREDSVLLLVPPHESKELIDVMADLLTTLDSYHSIGVARGTSSSPLRFLYTKVKSEKDLATIGEHTGTELALSDDVPMLVINNRMRRTPRVVTLMDILENEEEIYASYRPIKVANSRNREAFMRKLEEKEDDELILLQYSPSSSLSNPEYRTDFYERCMQGLGDLKRIEAVFLEDEGWAEQDTMLGRKLQEGEIILMQKVGPQTLDSAEKVTIPSVEGQWSVYSVTREEAGKPLKMDELVRRSGEEFYKRNLSINPELSPGKSTYQLQFRFDRNLMGEDVLLAIYSAFKRVRETLDKVQDGHDYIRLSLASKGFSPSEGRMVSLKIIDRAKETDRFSFLFQNKSREEMKRQLIEKPHVSSNHSFEYDYPADLGFSPEEILTFVDRVTAGQVSDEIVSEQPPRYERFSRKVTGQNWKEKIKENPLSQAVFLYSKSCGSCKKFTPLYEGLAKKNVQQKMFLFGKATQMNRMDKDLNDIPEETNYDSAPVFLLFRGDWKKRPFMYKQNYLTEKLLQEFLSVTQEFELLGEEGVRRLSEKRGVELDN